jgi:putative N6-adenine-specific DNA methylase
VARHLCLAVCAPGVEPLTATELGELGVRIRRTFRGGVEFSATDRQLYAANVWLRTANRIVVRAGLAFTARTFTELQRQMGTLPWDRWIGEGRRPQVRVTSVSSHLFHTGAVAERVEAMLATGDRPGPLVVVRLMHDRVLVSVDSSGAPLFRRGWRLDGATAPLRETLAAAAVLASGWDRRSPLVDPFCGSGTIPIEAALLAAGAAPGRGRSFAFQEWPSFQPGTWASVAGAAQRDAGAAQRDAGGETPPIVGADRDEAAIGAATSNAARAGVSIDWRHGLVSSIAPGEGVGPGWILSNPPYGKRASADRGLYARFGGVVRARFAGWTVGLLVAEPRVVTPTGLAWREALRTTNGGIPVSLLLADAASSPPAGGRSKRAAAASRRSPPPR